MGLLQGISGAATAICFGALRNACLTFIEGWEYNRLRDFRKISGVAFLSRSDRGGIV